MSIRVCQTAAWWLGPRIQHLLIWQTKLTDEVSLIQVLMTWSYNPAATLGNSVIFVSLFVGVYFKKENDKLMSHKKLCLKL